MTSQFSSKVAQILAFSKQAAQRLDSRKVCPEHLLLALVQDPESPACRLLQNMHVDRTDLQRKLEEQARGTDPLAAVGTDPSIDEHTSKILKLAVLEARRAASRQVEETHLLLAILHDHDHSEAKQLLEDQSVTYDSAVDYFKDTTPTPSPDERKESPAPQASFTDDEDDDDGLISSASGSGQRRPQTSSQSTVKGQSNTPIIDTFGTDLTKAAQEGKLDAVVGREREIHRVTEILCRRKKNNPVLIGEPGVGKSAIAEGLAQMIARRQASPALYGKRVVSIDLGAMVAGTKYRGQFEERVKALVKELTNNPNIILFIDEIHTLVGAGSAPGTMDAANMLKPALARGTVQCIGATTLDEYRNSIEKDGALERRFQKVMVEPTTAEQTLHILRNIKDRYEQHHCVNYMPEALEACVRLTERYVTDRCFPDKAIDALDEVGARVFLRGGKTPEGIIEKTREIEEIKEKKNRAVKNQNFELAASYRDQQQEKERQLAEMEEEWKNGKAAHRQNVTEEDVAEVVSMMSGVPASRVAEDEGQRLCQMADTLKKAVVAQDRAIDSIVRAIQRNRLGLKDPNRPVGVFMFLGPTGVGKTYLAKKLAEIMFGSADALIRIDMSEYSESFNTSRMVGAPPGYVGYDEGGQLTERVRRRPYSIVLLDEIEKAHGNVFNMLLQVMDEGRMTDGNGRLIDFRNTIVIMTSNAGTRQLGEFGRGIGFNAAKLGGMMDEKDKEFARSIIQKSLSKQFSPEFLNRLDEIVTFDQLGIDAVSQIIDLELKNLYRRMGEMGYELEVTTEAKKFVAEKGYDVRFGARPLRRAIQTYIEDGVCSLLLGGKLTPGNTIVATKKEGEDSLSFEIKATQTPTADDAC